MKLREILKVSALLFACHAFLPAGAQESGESVRTGPLLYGSVINANGWNWSNSVYGFYSIEPRENTSVDLVKEVNVMSSDNGIYADGKYYFTKAYENSGELSYLNSYVYDATTFTEESSSYSYYPKWTDYPTSACTYDPVTQKGYGVSLDGQNTGTPSFNVIELTSFELTPLNENMPVRLLTLACNQGGAMFGVGEDGVFYSVEKTTGALTAIGDTGIDPEGSQSMAFSNMTGTLYWAAYKTDGTSGLYEIDLSTGAARLISNFANGERIVGLFVIDPDASPDAPAQVSDLEAVFENGSLEGKIRFTVPSTTFGGNPLSGKLSVKLQIDQLEAEVTEVEAGSVYEVTKTLERGEHAATVSIGNEIGFSPTTSVTFFVGNDAPEAVGNLTFSVEGKTASLSWTAPENTLHGGYLDVEGLNYTIVRNPGNVTVATNYKQTSFSETLPEQLASYSYSVTAFVDDIEGYTATSEKVISGEAMNIPYTEAFDTEDGFALYSTYSENPEGNVWKWNSSEQSAEYNYNSNLPATAWMFTPPLSLETGKEYRVTFDIKTSSSYQENLKVTYGQTNNAKGQTELLDLYNYTSPDGNYETHTVVIKPSEAGKYYVGFYAYSDANKYYIRIDNLRVEEGASMEAPAGVTDLAVAAGPEDALKVSLAFNAPTKKYNGEPLEALSEVRIYKGSSMEAEHVFDSPEMGSRLEWIDENAVHGMNSYRIVAYNDIDGEGETVVADVYAGEDNPRAVENLRIVGSATYADLYWEAPSKGQHGGYVNAEGLTYKIMRYNELLFSFDEIGTTNELTFRDENPIESDSEARQNQVRYAVVPMSEEMGNGPMMEGKVIVGEAYTLPFHESFANATAENSVWMTEVVSGEQSWALAIDMDIDPVVSQDGDNGCAYFMNVYGGEVEGMLQSPVITLKDAVHPALTFYVYHSGEQLEGEYYIETLAACDGNGFEKVGDRISIYNEPGVAGWKKYIVPLEGYAGKEYFQFAFTGYADSWEKYILVDNVTLAELPAVDMAIGSLDVPAELVAGKSNEISVVVNNEGYESTASVVSLYVDGAAVATEECNALGSGESATVIFNLDDLSVFNVDATLEFQAVVTADGDANESNNRSAKVAATVVGNDLEAVDDLAGAQVGSDVVLTWSVPSGYDSMENPLQGFNIYRDGEFLAFAEGNVATYTDAKPAKATYEYVVTAVSDNGESMPSNVAEVTVGDAGIGMLSAGIVVRTEDNSIIIEGAEGADIRVYSANGLNAYSESKAGSFVCISVSDGVYIVVVGNQVTKVVVD